ncbi:1901_t:CDS:2 [Funneliformis caledonium]|uniref:1901_t:CDS:1 n=1 Tax=Funneliformis caledonium TaxID=1117310 RepID=A0A9N8WMG2_9GLOM|nr:1901_t:CDS:2 [Funneliformis caledonium]
MPDKGFVSPYLTETIFAGKYFTKKDSLNETGANNLHGETAI